MVESWLQELNRKYKAVTNTRIIENIDRANEIICEAIGKLDAIKVLNRKN